MESNVLIVGPSMGRFKLCRSIFLFQDPAWRPGHSPDEPELKVLVLGCLLSAGLTHVCGRVVLLPVVLFVHLWFISRNDMYYVLLVRTYTLTAPWV